MIYIMIYILKPSEYFMFALLAPTNDKRTVNYVVSLGNVNVLNSRPSSDTI